LYQSLVINRKDKEEITPIQPEAQWKQHPQVNLDAKILNTTSFFENKVTIYSLEDPNIKLDISIKDIFP
jgi:hypothetical protein